MPHSGYAKPRRHVQGADTNRRKHPHCANFLLQLRHAFGIPKAAAYSLNFTVIVPSGEVLGYLTAFPDDGTQPLSATLNAPIGGIIGNSAIVPGGGDGGINVFVTNTTHLVIDANGYFIDQTNLPGSTGLSNTRSVLTV